MGNSWYDQFLNFKSQQGVTGVPMTAAQSQGQMDSALQQAYTDVNTKTQLSQQQQQLDLSAKSEAFGENQALWQRGETEQQRQDASAGGMTNTIVTGTGMLANAALGKNGIAGLFNQSIPGTSPQTIGGVSPVANTTTLPGNVPGVAGPNVNSPAGVPQGQFGEQGSVPGQNVGTDFESGQMAQSEPVNQFAGGEGFGVEQFAGAPDIAANTSEFGVMANGALAPEAYTLTSAGLADATTTAFVSSVVGTDVSTEMATAFVTMAADNAAWVGEVFAAIADCTVLCTELNRQGLLDKSVLIAEKEYTDKNIDDETYTGYRMWADHLVPLMRKSKLVTYIVYPFAASFAKEMASRVDKNIKGSLFGRLVLFVGIPMCKIIFSLRGVAYAERTN